MTGKQTVSAPESAHGMIEWRAYEIWESEGRPHGHDLEHWLRAERECASSDMTRPTPKSGSQPAVPSAAKRKAAAPKKR